MIITALFLPDAEQFNMLHAKLAVGSIAQCKSVLPMLFCSSKVQSIHLKTPNDGNKKALLRH